MTNEELIVKIKTEIKRLKNQLIRGACAAQIEMRTMCKEEAYDEVLSFLSTIEKSEPEKMLGGIYSSYDIAKAFVEGQYSILKNLNKYCSSFKPSEEQMTVLRDVITMKRAVNEFAETKLRELYDQLMTQKEND